MNQKPTVNEIAAYMAENNLKGFTPEQFLGYYTNFEWDKVKDWKKVASCLSNWEAVKNKN